MIPIRNHGRLLTTDPDGFLIRDAHPDKIEPPWQEAVDFARQAIGENLQTAIHSIYLRGSVPRGLAVEGLSDIDTFFVVHGGDEACLQLDLSWRDAVRSEFARRFPFAQGMELMCIALARATSKQRENFGLRFLIKVESVCLYGQDLGRNMPPVSLDQVIEHKSSSLSRDLASFHSHLETEDDKEEIEERCRSLMKRLLREGMRLVMARERAYTRDLYPAYACFANYYPQQEGSMRKALKWALNPVTDKKQLVPFAHTFGQWLMDADAAGAAQCAS